MSARDRWIRRRASELSAQDRWIRRFHPTPQAPVALVCFPYAGGTAKYFAPAARCFTPDAEVLAVQYPGRQERRNEPVIDDIEELTGPVVDALVPWTDRPLALFGHSMGAALAFEVARRLEGKGVVPIGLFVSGRRAPSRYRDERTYLLDDDRLVAAVRELAGPSARLPGFDDFARLALPLIRGDYKAIETYRYVPGLGPELTCPVVALVGDDDPLVTVGEVAAWCDHTTGPFELHVFPGGHFYLDNHLTDILSLISQRLAQV